MHDVRRKVFTWIVALAGLLVLPATTAGADECWLTTPPGYQGIGGAQVLGPYPDWYAAQRVNQQYFDGWGTISCRKTGGNGSAEVFAYGAAKFHNRTSGTVSFSVRTKPGGAWKNASVASGAWHWFWQECPCRFHCTWDSSFAPGYQARTREVWWYGFDRQPSDSQARNWQFIQQGPSIDLVEGADAPIPDVETPSPAPAPSPATRVSFIGRGSGEADAPDFREAKSARGTWTMSFLPRINGLIPELSGGWQLQWLRIEGRRDDPLRTEVWNLSMDGFHGVGYRHQTLNIRLVGGAGTIGPFTTGVPGHEAAGLVPFRVGVQFVGSTVNLSFLPHVEGAPGGPGAAGPARAGG